MEVPTNMKNLSLSRQILVWFSALILVVLVYVGITVGSMEQLWESTVGLYEHPLTTRRAVSEIEKDVLIIHRYMMQLVTDHQADAEETIQSINLLEADAYDHIEVLTKSYLGPQSDVTEIRDGLVKWKAIRDQTISLFLNGKHDEARARVENTGVGGSQAAVVLKDVENIAQFAKNKAEEFFGEATEQRNQIRYQTILVGTIAIGLLLLIGYFLRNGIVPPLRTLTQAAENMRQGHYQTRVPVETGNELGVLAKSFNTMAETIAAEMEYRDRTVQVSSAMFHANAMRPFCQDLLESLMLQTHSQLGAVNF